MWHFSSQSFMVKRSIFKNFDNKFVCTDTCNVNPNDPKTSSTAQCAWNWVKSSCCIIPKQFFENSFNLLFISLLAMLLLKLQCLLLLSISYTLKQILTSFTEIFKLFYLFLLTTLYNYSRSIIYFQCNLICQTLSTSLSADISVVNTFDFGRGFNCPYINNRREFYCPKNWMV